MINHLLNEMLPHVFSNALQMQYTLLQSENRGPNSPILGIWKQHQDYISLTI